jgi:hypothetical protein
MMSVLPASSVYFKKLEIEGFKGEKVGPEFYGNDSSAIEPRFRSLEYLSFVDMQEWQEWVIFEGEVFPCLRELHIYNCPKLSRGLPNELPSLTKLVIRPCKQLVASFPKAPALQEFNVEAKIQLTSGHYYPSLESIYIDGDGHHSLWSFPLELFPMLKSIRIDNCENLNSFSASEGCHPNLTSLTIYNCPNFVSILCEVTYAPNLISVSNCEKLKSLPEGMHALLPALVNLGLVGCPELESFPEEGLPSNLEELEIFNCDKLFSRRREWRWHSLRKLREFRVGSHCEESRNFPEEAWLPSTLTHLQISSFRNLKLLNGKGFQHLTSLKSLWLQNCNELQCSPEEGLPTSLFELIISGCPLLGKRCEEEKGEDWDKIAAIPYIEINHRPIGSPSGGTHLSQVLILH